MSINVVDTYLAWKVKHITKYSKILLKNVYKAKSDNTVMLEKCLNKYFKYYILGSKTDNDFLSKTEQFCFKNNINNEKEKQVIAILFDTIPRLNVDIIDSESIKNILTLSGLITIAITLEEYTTSITGNNISYRDALSKIKLDIGPIVKNALLEVIKLSNLELKKLVIENTRTIKKFLTLQKKVSFHLDFFQVSDMKKTSNSFFEVEVKYDTGGLENIDAKKIDEVVRTSNIESEHTLITIQKLSVLIFKELLEGKNYNKFFVKLPNSFFDKKQNIKQLINITDILEIKNKIGFKINGIQVEKNYDEIVSLKDNHFSIAVDDSSYSNNNVDKVKTIADYIFIEAQLSEENDKLFKMEEENNVCFILKEMKHSEIFLDL